jgi:hypothetical protein
MSNFLIDEDTDLLAAEFVLGTLDSEERANAQSLLRMDHGFIAMVRIWERRFGELHLMVEPVEPDAKIFERVKAKIVELAASAPAPDGKPTAAAAPATEGKPPADATASPPKAEPLKPDPSKAEPAKAETPKPVETSPSGELPKPPDAAAAAATVPVPVDGTPPKAEDAPASEASPKGESARPPELPPAPALVVPGPIIPTAVVPPAAEVAAAVPTEPEPVATVGIPAPPPLAPPALKLPDKSSDRVADVLRSRGRWRMLGICMTLLVVGWVALLAAWRFIPDRLPARLRPTELMISIGIQALPPPATAVKPAPPESQFDE